MVDNSIIFFIECFNRNQRYTFLFSTERNPKILPFINRAFAIVYMIKKQKLLSMTKQLVRSKNEHHSL